MNDSQRQTRSYLMQLFEQRGFHPRGDLGQNFLIDLNLIDSIVEQAELSQRDVVLEVGAGTGGLTMSLAESAGRVVSVEYDRRVYELAESALAGRDNVTLLRCDALKNKNRLSPRIVEALETALAETGEADAALKLVANLPYNIATPVISNLIASDLPWTRMIVTVQYELGRRLAAKPGTGNFGALSVWVQSQCRVKLLKKLPPNVFWPRPQVNSAVMRITLDHTRRARIEDRALFQTYVRGVFNLRRKLLRRVLYGLYRADLDRAGIDRILEELGLDPQQRAEKMDVETHILLANRLKRKIDARPAVGSAKECC